MTRLFASSRFTIAASLLAGVILAAAAFGQTAAPKAAPAPARAKMEYIHQEIQSDALVQTLNDLDGQGWEMFQVVPMWSIRNDNGETMLFPKAYQVFGRRAVPGK